jgi:hypothetical protein
VEILSLSRFHCFSKSSTLLKLNSLAEIHDSLMPHQVASATGCELDDAMALLLFLSTISVVQAKLFVYHIFDTNDPPVSIYVSDIAKGPPKLPIICENCGQTIESYDELSFDFVFLFKKKVKFA